MPVQTARDYVEEFKARQNCESVVADNGCELLFANGARIQFKDPHTGEAVAIGDVEPPFDDEDSLRRQLNFYRTVHRREFKAFDDFKHGVLSNASYFTSGMDVLPPVEAEVEQLAKGKAKCDACADKIAELSAAILALPRIVEIERQRKQAQEDRQKALERAESIRSRVLNLSVIEPQALLNPALDQ